MGTEESFLGELAVAGGQVRAHGSAMRAILWGTLVAGSMDITAAIVTWWFRDVPPIRILQSVAGGLLGRDTYSGGGTTATLGLLLHFSIMCVIVAVFVFASSRISALTRNVVVSGVAYGIAVYLVMTYVVVPLSASPGGRPSLSMFVQGVIVHILCVGMPIALIASRFVRTGSQG